MSIADLKASFTFEAATRKISPIVLRIVSAAHGIQSLDMRSLNDDFSTTAKGWQVWMRKRATLSCWNQRHAMLACLSFLFLKLMLVSCQCGSLAMSHFLLEVVSICQVIIHR